MVGLIIPHRLVAILKVRPTLLVTRVELQADLQSFKKLGCFRVEEWFAAWITPFCWNGSDSIQTHENDTFPSAKTILTGKHESWVKAGWRRLMRIQSGARIARCPRNALPPSNVMETVIPRFSTICTACDPFSTLWGTSDSNHDLTCNCIAVWNYKFERSL